MSIYTPSIRQLHQSGKVSVNPVPNTPTTEHVTFEDAFVSVPRVVATAQTTVPGTTVLGVGVTNITKTGFDVVVTRTNDTATSVNWVASLTNDLEINMSMWNDQNSNPGTTKKLKHKATIYPSPFINDLAFEVEAEWILKDAKGAFVRSGYVAFKSDGVNYYETPVLTFDFAELPIGNYELCYETAPIPGFGVFKDHQTIKQNAQGLIIASWQ